MLRCFWQLFIWGYFISSSTTEGIDSSDESFERLSGVAGGNAGENSMCEKMNLSPCVKEISP